MADILPLAESKNIKELISAVASLTSFVNPPFMFIIRYIIGSVFDPLLFFLMLEVFKEKVNKKTLQITCTL